VRAINLAWPREFAYWLVFPDAGTAQPKITAFHEWVLEQSEALARQPPKG
jgi:hypothetical protein